MIDDNLRQYATDRQWELYLASHEYGSSRKAAKALQLNKTTITRAIQGIKKRAAKAGYSPEHDFTHPVPDGFQLKGTSTLYDEDGNKRLQWVKSSVDQQRQQEIFKEAAAGFADDLPRVKPTPVGKDYSSELMACYPIGDHHFGMLAWEEETGDDYDLEIGERLLNGAIQHLVDTSPKCGQAVIAVLGDFLHYDSMQAVTPTSGNVLDSDTRFPKLVRTAIRSLRFAISVALKRHNHIKIIIEIGNHDLSSSVFLAACLAGVYENEPRVTIDQSPMHFHYFQHGKCLVGTHHGHGVKLSELPLLMATHIPEEWGKSEHRYWWTGHVHHDQVKDFNGCRVESFRILPPADAYAANKGYAAKRDMKAIILHSEYGEVARHLVTPQMLS